MVVLSEAQTAAAAASKPVPIMCGNTAVGVVKYLTANPDFFNTVLIDLNFLPSLATCSSDASGLTIDRVHRGGYLSVGQAGTAAFQE